MAQALVMSGEAKSRATTSRADLDRAVDAVRDRAAIFARLHLPEKIALVRAIMAGVQNVARGWVAAGCRAKGLDPPSPAAGEEWLAGPVTTVRNLRLIAESLGEIQRHGRPRLGQGVHERADGRIEIDVFPASLPDRVLFSGFTGRVLMEPGVGRQAARERQAAFYQKRGPAGGVSLILGAGNVSSIPPMDAIYKMFVEGNVCILKMNPVNEWVGPFLERAFAPLIVPSFFRIVYGGADVGSHLVGHPGIDDVHITGSERTHDLIVWGPPGPERDRRKREQDPVLKKRITSELGNVSPIAIVPGDYTEEELRFQARNVASTVANNASFNCNAGKVLITARGWKQRGRFIDLLRQALGAVPVRKAYYPGAFERYQSLLAGRGGVEKYGTAAEGTLAWAFVPGVNPENRAERLFQVEPFCGILTETAVGSADAIDFLEAATAFMNDRLWGTLNATIIIAPEDEHDPAVAAALDRAVVALRYGTVSINHWAALGYGLVTPPWGGHPSATLADIQSGLGFVHNTFMLDGVEKTIVRGPIRVFPKPAWFADNRQADRIGERLFGFEFDGSLLRMPALALAALLG